MGWGHWHAQTGDHPPALWEGYKRDQKPRCHSKALCGDRVYSRIAQALTWSLFHCSLFTHLRWSLPRALCPRAGWLGVLGAWHQLDITSPSSSPGLSYLHLSLRQSHR